VRRNKQRRPHIHEPSSSDRQRAGLQKITLILLVVLAALSLFNIRQKTRSDVGQQLEKVQESFALIGGALRRYGVDYGIYALEKPGLHAVRDLTGLTTPIAYLLEWSATEDPFSPEGIQVALPGPEGSDWVLLSAGPDRHWDVQEELFLAPLSLSQLLRLQYDPTNGLISSGDIMALGR